MKTDGKKKERAARMRTHTAKVLPTKELKAASVSKNFIEAPVKSKRRKAQCGTAPAASHDDAARQSLSRL